LAAASRASGTLPARASLQQQHKPFCGIHVLFAEWDNSA
jgi:hypothetical protein